MAKHVNELVGEHVKARKAQIDKVRILKHEVRGDLPMAHLLKHSTYFVTDATLEMQLVEVGKTKGKGQQTSEEESEVPTPAKSGGEGGGSSGTPASGGKGKGGKGFGKGGGGKKELKSSRKSERRAPSDFLLLSSSPLTFLPMTRGRYVRGG